MWVILKAFIQGQNTFMHVQKKFMHVKKTFASSENSYASTNANIHPKSENTYTNSENIYASTIQNIHVMYFELPGIRSRSPVCWESLCLLKRHHTMLAPHTD